MANFYDVNNKNVVTEKVLEYKGFNTSNIELLNSLGYYQIDYEYIPYNKYIENMVPSGNPVKSKTHKNRYVQKFKVVELTDEELSYTLEACANSIRNDVLQNTDNIAAPYMEMFSQLEINTWPKQAEEITAYLADNTAPTPNLDKLAEYRGITRAEMLEKVTAKVLAFTEMSLKVVGTQQRFEDIINGIVNDESMTKKEKISALQAIDTNFSNLQE